MPKYRVLEKSFINNALVEEGAIVTYDEKPGPNLEPMDAAAETARAEADSTLVKGVSAEDIARQRMAAAGGSPDAVEAEKAASAAAAAAGAVVQGEAPTPTAAPNAGDLV
jgi:hypothetical protein